MDIKRDLIKFTPRKEQQDVLDFISSTLDKKEDMKFFMLNLPTGTGKSYLAMMIIDFLNDKYGNIKSDIITATKILQDQYSESYDSPCDLKGKENYKCSQYECSCASGQEFNSLNKTKCDFCPYDSNKIAWLSGQISLTNFYLYLFYSVYNPKVLESRKSKVLIVDECHELDSVMSDFISIKITESGIKKLKFPNEDSLIKHFNSVENIHDYIEYLEFLLSEIGISINIISDELGINNSPLSVRRDIKISSIIGVVNDDIKIMKILSELKSYELKIVTFLTEYKSNPKNWSLEITSNFKTNQRELSLEPIWSAEYLKKYVWDKYDVVILMSGTILNKKLFSELNGIDLKRSSYYSISSPFPLKNRPIYYMPVGKMSYNKKEETFKKYIPIMDKIFKKYTGKKGIIHTNSFELADWIKKSIKNDRLIFHTAEDKNEALKSHFDSEDDHIIVSPSFGTGVSFDHDKARFQIIAKVPYPSLNSEKNKLRKNSNPNWYAYKTVCTLLQSCGRCVRSNTDYADTIIIDESFGDIMRYSSNFLPEWFQESIKSVKVK